MKQALLFFLFSIFANAQSLDATFGSNGVTSEQSNVTNSSQIIYDEVIHNDKKLRVGSVVKNFNTKGVLAGYNASGLYLLKEIGTHALQTICVQSDDKILVVSRNVIYRVLTDGNFDTSFNVSGNQIVDFGTYPMNIKCISTQPDGKIVVSGYVSNGANNDFAIARLNADGSFDTSFDSDGKQSITFGTSQEQAFSHKMQVDGKIVIVGESYITNYDFAIVRLNTDGSLDTTFNGTGLKTIDFSVSVDRARTFEILPDGKIMIFGQVSGKFGLAKLNSDGISLDSSFGNSGKAVFLESNTMIVTILPTSIHYIPKIKVLSDGKIIINGTSNNDIKFIKVQSDGQLDTTFGENGVCNVSNDIDYASSFHVNNLNEISFTGATTSTGNYKLFTGNISSDGIIMNSFTDFFWQENYFKNFKILPDGKMIVALSKPYLSVMKYNADGSLDYTFGSLGTVSFLQESSWPPVLKILPDGKILVAGNRVYRLNPNGSLDTSFNSTGIFQTDVMTSNKMYHADELYLTSDNKIILSCEYETSSFDHVFGLLRINQNGSIDTTYGTNGFYITKIHPIASEDSYDYAFRVLEQTDNKLLMVGISGPTVSTTLILNSFVMRMSQDAVVDTSYGTNGLVYIPFVDDFSVKDAVILPNDKLLLNFVSLDSSKTLKLNADGSLDTTYGINGTSVDVAGSMNLSMAIQSDGKLLKAGKRNNQFSISRYNTDGTIDITFGTDGEVNVINLSINPDWGFKDSSFSKILLQSDGKIIAGGNSFDGYYQVSTLVRLTNTVLGTLDFTSTKNTLSIYPNPIETAATFEFTLMNPENITIELYDVQGKLVQTIATNKEMAPGNHNLPIELNSNLTSGNYFLKLTTVNGSQSIQIIKK